jgi:hypothetical protein
VEVVGELVPIVTIVLIAGLIIRARITSRPISFNMPRWRPPVRRAKPPLKLVPFDRTKMDDELAQLLRNKR